MVRIEASYLLKLRACTFVIQIVERIETRASKLDKARAIAFRHSWLRLSLLPQTQTCEDQDQQQRRGVSPKRLDPQAEVTLHR